MSRIEELIREKCPDGVEYKTLGELGEFFGGLTGKSKDDFLDGNAVFITYKNVYSNPSLDVNPSDKVKISEGENQHTLKYGDVIFTGSSETPDECGISSVVTKYSKEKLYLNSFCFVFRFNDLSIMEPNFAKHLFRTYELRCQIRRTASGVTRYNVSKDKMRKVEIPVPPIEVQQEIVRLLDKFTELEAELQAELDARKRQYEYYRDELLVFAADVECVELGNIVPSKRGKRVVKSQLSADKGYPVYQNSLTPLGYHNDTNCRANTTFIICAGAAGEIGYSKEAFWAADDCYYYECSTDLYDRYLFYVMINQKKLLKDKVRKGSVPRISRDDVDSLVIPLPSLEMQIEIVSKLDKWDAICNDHERGLPAEIAARHKQYEYYRDKLLTFKRKEV